MRKRLGVLVHVLAVVALVPAYLLLAPASDWSNPLLLAVLAALAVIAIRHDVPLPSGIAFDASVKPTCTLGSALGLLIWKLSVLPPSWMENGASKVASACAAHAPPVSTPNLNVLPPTEISRPLPPCSSGTHASEKRSAPSTLIVSL